MLNVLLDNALLSICLYNGVYAQLFINQGLNGKLYSDFTVKVSSQILYYLFAPVGELMVASCYHVCLYVVEKRIRQF